MTLTIVALLPLLGALAPALVGRRASLTPAWVAAAVLTVTLIALLTLAPGVFAGEIATAYLPWLERHGLDLALRLDGLGLLFALLILGIGLLIVLYARYYLSPSDPLDRFYALLLLFAGAMLGIVLADNVIVLVVFWEITSLTSFLLVGYWYHRQDARQAARMALAVTGMGGLALLAGLLLLGEIAGSYRIGEILQAGPAIRAHPLYLPTLVLICLGAFTKSAQFPLHFWLPRAMAAPTPVSAYLHSATMVKAGVFLLARFHPALSGTETWFFLVSGAGLATLLFASITALFQHDIKGLLAYSTIGHLGLIVLLLGFGTPLGAVAAVFHIINHAIFKGSLFMAAGIIDHESGSRDMRRLNGLFRYIPYTGMLAMVATAAMAGVPLFNGFLSKEMFFAETLQQRWLGTAQWILPVAATVAGAFAVAYSIRFIHDVFFNGEPVDLPRTPHEPPRWMLVPVEILVTLCLAMGIVPALLVGGLIETAAATVIGGPLPHYELSLGHASGTVVAMSLTAFGGGALIYLLRRRLFDWQARFSPVPDGKVIHDNLIAGAVRMARAATRALEGGGLQRHVAWLVGGGVILGVAGYLAHGGGVPGAGAVAPEREALDAVTAAGAALLVVASLATVALQRRRLTALVMLGVVGLLVSLAFVRFHAPDLALTQLAVEIVTVLLLLLALYFLPQEAPRESARGRRARDAAIALAAGGGVAALAWGVLRLPGESVSRYYIENALPEGGGHNVVNVILVDFRAFDTLGEITVLAIAGLAIHAMLHRLRLTLPATGPHGRPWAAEAHPMVLATLSRPLLPLVLIAAIYFLLRGHNLPGGGFIAGLLAGVALILQYVANGIRWSSRQLAFDYHTVLVSGLLVAALTGAAAWWFGAPFLTMTYTHLHLPIVGDVELASALVFDLGVFLTVVGTVMLVLADLGRLGPEQRTAVEPVVSEEPS